MAVAVDFRQFTPRNSRADLMRKLEQAPEEHAEALLSAYDLLQRMHEKGLIELASGLLSASDTVVDRAVDVISSKQAVTALRALLMVSNLLNSIDADELHRVLAGSDAKPPSLWEIGKQAMSANARRGMATGVGLLNLLGAALGKKKEST
jgi:uncharacterized protein YjgD (DUF1641 family)